MAGVAAATPLRWAVVLADLDPIFGSEQAGKRRVLIVSYEPFHASGNITICPISARAPKYPNEVPIPQGHAGQTKDGVILIHQARTISAGRVFDWEVIAGQGIQYVTDQVVRRAVRDGLEAHFYLDVADAQDGA